MAAAASAAASSPAISNNGSETTADSGGKSVSVASVMLQRSDPSKNLRGLNKPKCITCGNVARSRCPFQCCKSCCSKAQNPCHIHVLKPNGTLADRGATANSAPIEQRPNEGATPLPPAKVTSIRQLSSTFSQFNNVHMPARSRKPLTMKEALVVNEWRFAKLKEYKESNVEAENDAFDRYMQNVNLLEEVFDVNSERLQNNNSQLSDLPTTSGEKTDMVSEVKAKLRSNPGRINTFKKRIRQTVDQGLRNLQFYDSNNDSGNPDNEDDPTPKAAKNWWVGKISALTELNDKLNRAKTVEDIKRCMQVRANNKSQAKPTSQKESGCTDISKETILPNETGLSWVSEKPLLKFVRATEIDQNSLNGMEFYFSSLEEIEDL